MKYFKVNSDTSPDEIKKQFKELAIKFHPDKGGPNEIMLEINAEYIIAKSRIQRYKEFADTDKANRQFLYNLADNLIDRVPEKILSRPLKFAAKKSSWKYRIIDSIPNTSDLIIWIEEAIQKHRKK